MHQAYDMRWFSNMLTKTLSRTHSNVVLHSQNISQGNSHVAQATPNSILEKSLLYSLSRYTEKYQQLIFLTEDKLTNWSERCLSFDLPVFLIGDPTTEQPLTAIAEHIIYQQGKMNTTLILEYPTKKVLQKKHITPILKPKQINAIHTFAKNNLSDFENIIQHMTVATPTVNYKTRKSVA